VHRLADIAMVVPSADTQHIQEVHTVLHSLSELVEEQLSSERNESGVGQGSARLTWGRSRGRKRAAHHLVPEAA
jgi:hypothetical protein